MVKLRRQKGKGVYYTERETITLCRFYHFSIDASHIRRWIDLMGKCISNYCLVILYGIWTDMGKQQKTSISMYHLGNDFKITVIEIFGSFFTHGAMAKEISISFSFFFFIFI